MTEAPLLLLQRGQFRFQVHRGGRLAYRRDAAHRDGDLARAAELSREPEEAIIATPKNVCCGLGTLRRACLGLFVRLN